MLWRSVTITVYQYEFDKSMLMCAIIIIKVHKIKQIFNDLPKIITELYLSSSIIKNVMAGLHRFFYLMLSFCLIIRGHICPMIPINDNWVLNNHDNQISLHCSNHHLKHHKISGVIGCQIFALLVWKIHIIMWNLECFRRHLNSLISMFLNIGRGDTPCHTHPPLGTSSLALVYTNSTPHP